MVLPVVATAAVRRAASSSLLRRRPTSAFPSTARAQAQQTRKMGGGQPESQSMKARLWEGHSPEPEGWEPTIYATYVVGFGLITLALGFSPDTSIASWANNEAQARLDLQASGKLDKPVFGTLYNTPEGTGVASDWDDFM
eukprot:CAMPEP_0185799290 /NCGR_PEP_ID=MMETSP1322-20130828/234_1 /TAXON_ID=265543 /ORGANISM="Minutocellus polymorphus, Strain RCC2270" /LENGTH=139 /DNA_ID=CAMNT_0028494851 /DNA_START=6 /DNA_END=422 /DNA_ORIENTATION=+